MEVPSLVVIVGMIAPLLCCCANQKFRALEASGSRDLMLHAVSCVGAGRARLSRHHIMRVDYEFLRHARVERLVGLGRLLERNQLDVDGVRNLDAIVKEWDLAHPSPRRIVRFPRFAASSLAPGSSVTYRPGMPIAPAARVASISWLSTTAGSSFPPCPLASKPTQSTAQSTSGTRKIFSSCSLMEPLCERSIVSQPNEWACSSRARLKSATITTAAPSRNAADAVASPTGPAPEIRTVEPVVTPALTHP